MSSFLRITMLLVGTSLVAMISISCGSQNPTVGSECVTAFDCFDGQTCEDGYCIDATTDQGTPTEKDTTAQDDASLPDYDPGTLPDSTDSVLPDDPVTDDGTIGPDADEPEVGDDAIEIADDATEQLDDTVIVTDDTEVATDDAGVTVDDAPVVTDDQPAPDTDTVEPDDATITDEDATDTVPDIDNFVDTTPPEVTLTSPVDGAVDVFPNANIVVTFSEELDPATVDAMTVVLVENGGGALDPVLTYDDKDFTVTLDPTADLTYGASYTVTVMTAITDLVGNHLAVEYVFSFTVTTCGNGSPDGTEACDEGSLNGTYDHCNLFCTGPGSHCGDGVTNLPQELCDTADNTPCDQIVGKTYVNSALVPCNGTCDGWVTTNCTCASGYKKDSNEDCVDIDECTENDNPCNDVYDSINGFYDAGATCTNTIGSYTCTCSSGFQSLGGVCRNINECLTLSNPCDNNGDENATCSDMVPDYDCTCSSGFEFRNGGCFDIDECAGEPCKLGGDVNATCNNLNADFSCNCSAGYQDNGLTCEEIDECAENDDPCDNDGDDAASCVDLVNGYACTCSGGFVFNEGGCKDKDECALQDNPCDEQQDNDADCENTVGSYVCLCSEGFAPGNGTCQDENECLVNNGGCDTDPMTGCHNTTGGRTCDDCPAGYTGNGADVGGCVDIDECLPDGKGPCDDVDDPAATCNNTPGDYTCTCSVGWYDNGTNCVKNDLCLNNPCDNNGDGGATCTDIGASYTCSCSSGWESNGTVCVDINECAPDGKGPCDNADDAGATCTNSAGSYSCNCSTGFTAGSGTCLDNNECVLQNNPCDNNGDGAAQCVNTPGIYTCTCSSGFDFTLGSCYDRNECAVNNGDCDPLTQCLNTSGGRTCGACPSGYTGDGYVGCTDVNECAPDGKGPCDDNDDPTATCTNSPGSYTCTCSSSGFRVTGGSCWDIDECAENTDNCHPTLATCTDTNGSFTCTCIPPATGNGVTCTSCGDAIVNGSETCDEGTALNGTYGHCNATCTGPGERCGDSIKNGPEQCDDGNSSNNDDCLNSCVTNVCGDSYLKTSGASAFTETFEGGSLPSYASGSTNPWQVDTNYHYQGSYGMHSRSIGDSQSSNISLSHYTDGKICFYLSGSSEGDYDYLRVYVDGLEKFSTTGYAYEGGWKQVCITGITAGTRTLEFRYSKDYSDYDGMDGYAIDNIMFAGALEECIPGQTTSCGNFGWDNGTATCSDCRWETSACEADSGGC
ncbi:MAG TPA: EGF domain-containing protein [bacterium]|nr:EGF domain-containing protein [bacterium]